MDSSEDSFDPYAELQLSPEAEPELIKAAFKALAKKYHPDRFSDPDDKARAEKKMVRINEAQTLLQSGRYRAPSPRPTESPSPAEPKVAPPPPPSARKSAKPKTPASIRKAPFVWLALLGLALLALPSIFSGNHLERALALEDKGQLQDSLVYLNKAISHSPHDRELYEHRARLWQKLGEPEKAAIDLKNAQTPTLQSSATPLIEDANPSPHQVREASDENSATHVP